MIATIIVLACLLLTSAFFIAIGASIYNRLVALDKQCDNGFAQIEVQLKRRYDLIPNLVETVRGYMQHENDTLERVIAARNQASQQLANAKSGGKGGAGADAVKSWIGAESALTGAMGKMSFVMENYPDLKANESVAALTEELRSTENKISFARQAYNDWCTAFNLYRESFPNIVLAPSFGFNDERTLLEFDDSEAIQSAPEIALANA